MRRLGTQRPSQNVNKSASEPQMCVPYRLCLFFASHASERPRTHLAKIQIAKKKIKKFIFIISSDIQSQRLTRNGKVTSLYFVQYTVPAVYTER